MESREDEFAPFLSFGEGDEEEASRPSRPPRAAQHCLDARERCGASRCRSQDKDYDDYLRRMRREGEWAGQPELLAAAQALRVDIVVHQYDAPNYRIEARRDVVEIGPRLARERRGHAQCGAEEYLSEVHVSYHDGEHYNSVRPLAGGNGATPSRGRGREGAAEGDEAAEHVSALTLGEAGETRGEGDCEGGGGEEGDGVGGGAAGEDADECAGGVGSGRKKGKRDKKAEKQARAMARRQAAALAAGGARTDEDGADEDQAGPVSGRDQTITL